MSYIFNYSLILCYDTQIMDWKWIFVLIAPMLYAVANLVDKIQLHGRRGDSRPLALMALGSVIGFIFIIPLGVFVYFSGRSIGSWQNVIAILLNELTYNIAILLYMRVLKKEEASNIIPWFQIVPMFGLVGAWLFLGEKLGLSSIAAILFVMLGGFILSYQRGEFRKGLFGIMMLCSAFFAIYEVIFAYFGRGIDPYSAIFLTVAGKTLWSLPILLIRKELHGFLLGLRTRLKFQIVGELTNLVADITMCVSLIYFPVALVQGTVSTQPFFILAGAIILTKFFKSQKAVSEDITKVTLVKKVIGITMLVIGGILFSI